MGKCPSGATDEVARDLLNDGVRVGLDGRLLARDAREPHEVYNVWGGIPYVAKGNTRDGYHGYPIHPSIDRSVSQRVWKQLGERARDRGTQREFKNWCRKSPERLT